MELFSIRIQRTFQLVSTLMETHDMATEAMAKTRKEFHHDCK